jgi:hypothetical protein
VDAGAEAGKARGLFKDLDIEAGMLEQRACCRAAEAGTDDRDLFISGGHGDPFFPFFNVSLWR